MKKMIGAVFASLLLATPAWAAPSSVMLSVANMTCVTCPVTVRMALGKVDGVSKAAVDFEKKEAVVTFDDAKTTVAALIKATTDAGYPSSVKQGQKR
jgi:mercuric ion binding protein